MLLANLRTFCGHSDPFLNGAALAPEIVGDVGALFFQRTTRRKRLVAGMPEYGLQNERYESLALMNLREHALEHHSMVTRGKESETGWLFPEGFQVEGTQLFHRRLRAGIGLEAHRCARPRSDTRQCARVGVNRIMELGVGSKQ